MDFTTMFDLMNSIDSNDVLVRSSPIWRISSSDHISRLNFDFFFSFFRNVLLVKKACVARGVQKIEREMWSEAEMHDIGLLLTRKVKIN
ncbi:hypothetical protein F4774DRAFT_400602 [Daldinia eschscholtzii]|nr:hypothetical protein F4774DRAFT_400602 [Daldinia eschscholtzii]